MSEARDFITDRAPEHPVPLVHELPVRPRRRGVLQREAHASGSRSASPSLQALSPSDGYRQFHPSPSSHPVQTCPMSYNPPITRASQLEHVWGSTRSRSRRPSRPPTRRESSTAI